MLLGLEEGMYAELEPNAEHIEKDIDYKAYRQYIADLHRKRNERKQKTVLLKPPSNFDIDCCLRCRQIFETPLVEGRCASCRSE